jgi:hypothetical protein
LKRHLNPATAISCVALFVALSGAAYAVSPIGKKAVKTQNLANGAVTTLKLRGGAVTTMKLRNLSVSGPKLGEASVTSGKLAQGAVRSPALGGQVVTEGKLKNGAVTGGKLANGAVTSSKLGADALTTGKVQDGAITAAKLAPSFLAQLVKGISYVTATSVSNADDLPKSVAAECPSGKQVTGGGARVVGGADVEFVAITESAPTANPESKRSGWAATAREITGEATDWAVEAYAVCAEF